MSTSDREREREVSGDEREVAPFITGSDQQMLDFTLRNACRPYGFCKAIFSMPILDYTERLGYVMGGGVGDDPDEF